MLHPTELLRGSMRLWYSRMLSFAPLTPAPRTPPIATVGTGPSDRVLLVGNGPLHGWGVLSHGMSVVGHLAEDLWRRTDRPARVEFVGDERMNAASATAWLGAQPRNDQDVVVVALGMNDALRLEPVPRWRASYRRLLDHLRAHTGHSVPIVLVELPRIRAYRMADGLLGSVAQHHAHRLNRVLHELAGASSRISVVPAPEERFEAERPIGSSASYAEWALQLGAVLAPVLDRIRETLPARPAVAEAAHDWAGLGAVLEAKAAIGGHAALTDVTRRAQERFGVALAAVNLLDGDRAWFVADTGGAPLTMPSELAYCRTTVRQDAPLVVLDAQRDVRFRDNPFLDVVQLPFYAGIPLHAADGTAIGTLCLLDSAPHDSGFADPEELRSFADEAERVLLTIEEEAGADLPSPVELVV